LVNSDHEGKDALRATFSSGLSLPFYLHELAHTIGLSHEQDRPDSGDYIDWDGEKTTCSRDENGNTIRNISGKEGLNLVPGSSRESFAATAKNFKELLL